MAKTETLRQIAEDRGIPLISATEVTLIADTGNLAVAAPQLIVSLQPDGSLCTELPGANGARRKIPLKTGQVEAMIREILRGKQAQRTALGEDGAPTAHQVRHWERHPHMVNGVTVRYTDDGAPLWADPMCPFCIAEGLIVPTKPKRPKLERVEAVRLGLTARGYTERAPGKWFASPINGRSAEGVLVTERGTVSGAMRGKWSRDATQALIADGYIEATRIGAGQARTLLDRAGITVRTVPKAALNSIRTPANKETKARKPSLRSRMANVEIRI
jgi:hypothetical protein